MDIYVADFIVTKAYTFTRHMISINEHNKHLDKVLKKLLLLKRIKTY